MTSGLARETRAGSVAVVLGTRPEIVKLAGVLDHLGDSAYVIHTGQHYDDDMSDAFLRAFGLGRPDCQLNLGGLSRAAQIGQGTSAIAEVFEAIRPAAVVVQGDTNSALAGALAANATDCPLVHVEAGLRSYDRAMPEEHNRVLIDHISDLLAAPTDVAVENLVREGIAGESVVCTGNTVVEAVRRQLPAAITRHEALRRLRLTSGGYVLATIHRPENTDDPVVLRDVLGQLAALPLPVVFPVHPRTAAAAARAGAALDGGSLRPVDPLTSAEFLSLAAEAAALVSDSGGVQEEATVLGVPLLVVRRSTERPEAVAAGFSELVGPAQIGEAARRLLADLPERRERLATTPSPYGDGDASRLIAEAVLRRYRDDYLCVGRELFRS